MATRSRTLLKSWFKRGLYPKAEQFADWIDSFWHKEEDAIPVDAVENLPALLNEKYARTDGEELAHKHAQLAADFATHEEANSNEFQNVYDGIKDLRATDKEIQADLVVVHDDISALQEKDVSLDGDISALRETDISLGQSLTSAHNDIGVIQELLKGGATLDQAKTALVALGNNYKDLYAVALTLKTFLEASDTADRTINTWQEIEQFLQGITDMESLTALLEQLEQKISEAYAAAIAAAVKTETDRALAAEKGLSGAVAAERERAEAAEQALGDRVTGVRGELKQTDAEIKQDIVAVKEAIFAIQAETAGRVIPLVMNLDAPKRITLGNPNGQRIKATLLPSFALQNVLYLGDAKAVDVDPDGGLSPLHLGSSRIHVIPTENTALHKTINVEVVAPSTICAAVDQLLFTGAGTMILT